MQIDAILECQKKILKKVYKVMNVLSGILLGLLTIVVFTEVLSRYIFNFSIITTTEMTMIIFPWMCFFAAINITIDREHISLVFIRDKITGKARELLIIFIQALMLAFSIIMFKSSLEISIALSSQTLAVLKISKVVLYGSVVVCFGGISIVLITQIMESIVLFLRRGKSGEK